MTRKAVEETETRITFMDAGALADPARFDAALERVSAARREKVLRLRPGAAQRLSLAAGLLLRDALAAEGLSAEDSETAVGAHGKPCLPRRPDVQFSLSHSGTWAMCAVADRPVGCDIQLAAPRSLRVARRFFTDAECARIFALAPEGARQAMFYRIWALKESFIKCLGLGLALPLDSFSVLPEADGTVSLAYAGDGEFRLFEPEGPEGCFCACCLRLS